MSVEPLAEYPPPNRRTCPICGRESDLFAEDGARDEAGAVSWKDVWWCDFCPRFYSLPSLRRGADRR